MKIGVVATSYPRYPGDKSGHWIHRANRELQELGVEVTVLAPHAPGLPLKHLIDGVPVVRFRYWWPSTWQQVAYRSGGLPDWRNFPITSRMQLVPYTLSLLAHTASLARQCDVVHAHWTLAGGAACTAKRFSSCPWVITLHGSEVSLGLMGRGLKRVLSRKVIRCADAVISVNAPFGDLVRTTLGVDNVFSLEFPIDVTEYTPGERFLARESVPVAQDKTLLLYAGNLVKLKGLDRLLVAFASVARRFPSACLALVGEGGERHALQKLANQLGVGDRVLMPGVVSREEMPDWYRACDVFVLSSLAEGGPYVVLEAMASGRAVVATRVGRVPEMIVNGETGLIVEPGSSEALSTAMTGLLSDDHLRHRLGAAARHQVLNGGHSWPDYAERLAAVYKGVLTAGRRTPSLSK